MLAWNFFWRWVLWSRLRWWWWWWWWWWWGVGGRVLSKFQNDWRNLLSKNIGNILTSRQTIISKDILAQWKFKYSLCAFNSLLVLKILQLISPQFRYKDLKTPYMDLRSSKHFKCLHHLCILIRSIFSILWHPL